MRVGLPSGASLPPFVDWPDDLAAIVRGEVVMLEGGHEFDGRPLVPFDVAGMRDAGAAHPRRGHPFGGGGSGVLARLNAASEEQAAAILQEEMPGRRGHAVAPAGRASVCWSERTPASSTRASSGSP